MRSNILKNKNKMRGFSIIELSIVLTIIALIASSALSVGASRIESARIKSTQQRMNFVMQSVELYVKRYGYLPCPSDNSILVTDADYGDGAGSGSLAASHCTANNLSTHVATNVLSGGVPTQQLNISPAISIDGWNRRFDYVVDEDLTYTDTTLGNGWVDVNEDGNIIIMNTTGGVAMANTAVMALISHGTNGHGAWAGKGGAAPINKGCAADLDEDENTSICPNFDNELVQKFRTSDYDDMLEYRMKWQFETTN